MTSLKDGAIYRSYKYCIAVLKPLPCVMYELRGRAGCWGERGSSKWGHSPYFLIDRKFSRKNKNIKYRHY